MSTSTPSSVHWRKSSHSDQEGGNCVEVGGDGVSIVAVRDSKDPDGPKLAFGRVAFSALASDIRAGRYDR
ncbi:DUF397 domain-containing protein [Actinomadura sp. BRA 177]|uniref:DUF397 domain-containing protein n=1 Tax=Actinomadura sp. BRA 177 TaxID=2745202 RepID=UPI0015957802|nr:DUF397 domain-containing protein [Actinomadura sp. BRA 177]NVI87865.1 DUF397 domain-containing protein [Actinomadura sp. BRA 177]